MKINEIKSNVSFKSGYPTFRQGHLGYKPEVKDLVYIGFRPRTGLLKESKKLDVLA